MRTRHTFVATLLVALLAIAGVTAAIAADPAQPPPPRIAFLANGRVPADALAAGPIAGQLGAPVYTTEQAVLPDSTGNALTAYNPELVIVMGGPVAISDGVVAQVSAATGLPVVDPTPPPTTGVVRAAGEDRFITATVVADLLSAYDPAYLGVDLQSVDADLLDGIDSSGFVKDSALLGAVVESDGSLISGRHAVSATRLSNGRYLVTFDRSLVGCVRVATPGEPGNGTNGSKIFSTEISSSDATDHTAYVGVHDITSEANDDGPFHLMVLC